jgi:hypothetical protein
MKSDAFALGGGPEESRFSPCFPRLYAPWQSVWSRAFSLLEVPLNAPNLSPRLVPKALPLCPARPAMACSRRVLSSSGRSR